MSWAAQFEEFCAALRIDSKEVGLVPLRLNGSQKYFVQEVMSGIDEGIRHFVILKGRQLGITTICLALDLFWAFKHNGMQGAIISDDDGNKEKFRDTIGRYYEALPRHMKKLKKSHNRYIFSFQNRSDFQYIVAGKRSGNEGLGRAKALNFIHATECAFWADQDGLDALTSSLAEKNPMRLYIFESTADGFNGWYDIWHTAKRAIRQKAIFIGWWRKEDYCFKPIDKEYQVYWKSAAQLSGPEKIWVKKIKQFYDFDITEGQIAWYRWHLAEQKKGDELIMQQEYPATEEDAFVVAGSKFFTGERLTSTYMDARREKFDAYRYVTGSEFQFTQIHRTNAQNAELKVWEEPRADGIYVMGADPAYGSSEWADRFALCVFRCYADRLIQVAEYCSPDIACYQFAWIIAHLGGAYKNIYLNLEITGPGGAVSTELMNLQRAAGLIPAGSGGSLLDVMGSIRHYFWMRPDNQLSGSGKAIHTKMDEYTKRAIMNSYKDSFEVARMELKSVELVNEMRSVVNEDGSIGASGRAKDDRVIAAALGHWVWVQSLKTQLLGRRMTYAVEQQRQQFGGGTVSHIQRQVFQYLKTAGIQVK